MSNKILQMKRFITDPRIRFSYLSELGFYKNMSDEEYLKKKFKLEMGRKLNLENPQTFNEKLQWLKIYDRKPIYTTMVDKYEAKYYVASIIGKEYIIPTLGVWDKFDDIDFASLPDQFVLKCTHDSGGLVICKDKNKLDKVAAKKKIEKSLRRNYYWFGREWPYKNVKPRIIAEKYMEDTSTLKSQDYECLREEEDRQTTGELTDYKFFCFDGCVDCVMVCLERSSGETKFYFFDKDWNLRRLNIRGKNAPEGFSIPKPKCIDGMFDIAATLSKGLSFARIDLYQSDGHIYFGEITFFPDSGFDANILQEADEYWGKILILPDRTLEKR